MGFVVLLKPDAASAPITTTLTNDRERQDMNLDELEDDELEEGDDEEELELPAHPSVKRKRKRARKPKPGAPKPGLGPMINRKRRQIQEALDAERQAMQKRQMDAAKQELERLRTRSKDRYATDHSRFGTALVKSVINTQTSLLRVFGYKQAVETKIVSSGRVIGWTDFERIRIEWALDLIPDRLDNDGVLDTIGQVKGVMQHEMGHLRFTMSWKTIVDWVKEHGTLDPNHDGHAKMLHKCWNMLEDQRMECLVVEVANRIAKYFGTMVANVVFGGNSDMATSWLMLAGRDYLPKHVRRQSFLLFDDYCNGQGIVDGGTTWWNLVQDYKAAASEQAIYDATVAAYEFILEVRATLPNTVDDMDPMANKENEGQDPAKTARQRGNALDIFDDTKKPGQPGKPGEQSMPGDGDDEPGAKGEGKPQPGDKPGERGHEPGHGNGPIIPTVEDFKETLMDYVDESMRGMRMDGDVRQMAGDAGNYVDTDGLPVYPDEGAEMDERRVERATATAREMEQALASFVTESEPTWEQFQDIGMIDPLTYRTKDVGDADYRLYFTDEGEDGLDIHVSMLSDVSGSMYSNQYGSKPDQDSPIIALSESMYSCALACKDMGIGSTMTLWSSGDQNYRIWPDGNPTPTLWPTMGGTDPNFALDDLDSHNPEGAKHHLVIIFTDGAWSSSFPSLQRWGAENRTIILVRYGSYDGAIQKDMGADRHIYINDVRQLPGELTNALLDVLGGGEGW